MWARSLSRGRGPDQGRIYEAEARQGRGRGRLVEAEASRGRMFETDARKSDNHVDIVKKKLILKFI